MLRICEKLRKADAKGRRYGLAHAETGYLHALVEAMADMDRMAEVELLKSLGDVDLEKGRLEKDAGKLNWALSLFFAALFRCDHEDQGESIKHRCEYTERLLRGVSSKGPHGNEQSTKEMYNETISPAKVAVKFQDVDRKQATSGNTDSVLVGCAQLMVEGIVNKNNMLETEAIKSLGDVYMRRGKETRDTTWLTKATAVYNTALVRCNNVQGTVVIVHRLRYTAKIRQDITATKMSRSKRTMRQVVRRRKDHDSPFSAAPSSDVFNESDYIEQLQEGCRALQTGDLDAAEHKFAAALRTVHMKDSTTDQYQEEVEPLFKLSDVYLERGTQSKDGSDFTKAAALCNAALVRAKIEDKEGIKETIIKISQLFIEHVLRMENVVNIGDIEKHKLMLKADREYVEKEMKLIEQEADPYTLDDDDPKLREVEKKRAEAVKVLFQTIAQQRKTFIAGLVEECIEVMGPPPSKYAMIGLGSQATELVTPYSDLEFAILVEDEIEQNVKYFHNLTHYLHLKVINLGETILPAMAIKSFNDPGDNWFYDSVTPRGLAFDEAMPHACKTPLGRGRSCQLIHTPDKMITVLNDDLSSHLKRGYHLASILGNVCLITGKQDLVDEYTALWTQQLQRRDQGIYELQAFTILGEEANSLKLEIREQNVSLFNVRKDIYRFSTLAIACLALLGNVQPTTIWETIQKLQKKRVINSENAHHLMVMVSISAELRLQVHMNNHGQVETMSAIPPMSEFYLSNSKKLMRYYYTARPLRPFILLRIHADYRTLVKEQQILYDNSSKLQAEVYADLCEYKNARKCLERALEFELSKHGESTAHPDIAEVLMKLGAVCSKLGEYDTAVSYYNQSLQMMQSIYGKSSPHPTVVESLTRLGAAWSDLGDHRKAISYYEKSLQKKQTIYGEGIAHPDIANSLHNLGNAWSHLGDHRKAVSYYDKALQMRWGIYGENTARPDIADSLNNLGSAWSNLGIYRKAVSCYEQSLQMWRNIYGEGTANSNVAVSLNNLGNIWSDLGDHRKAISYHEQSLKMIWSIYGKGTAHPRIADSLNNLGTAWSLLGDYRKAISYHEQSLKMRQSVYGENKAHPDIVVSLHNLGETWSQIGDYRKAISYYEQSLLQMRWSDLGDHRKAISYYERSEHLQMRRSIFVEDSVHPDIATTLSNLGVAWSLLGDHRKAITYYEQSLQMWRSIYGEDTARRDISLRNLSIAWWHLGDHRKAISYFEPSLQIMRSIYDEDTAHRDIATSLNNLGAVWRPLGDYRKAISYYEQSLQMRRTIHGEDTAHPDIAASLLNNLGDSCSHNGDYGKAISYYEQSLEMRRSIYGEDTAHPNVASSLTNLGIAWSHLGDHRKAVSYHEQSLQMKLSIYGDGTVHPDIVASLNNLGNTWRNLGDYGKAISYYEQSLQMMRSIYGEDTAHPFIAISLTNLGNAWSDLGDHRKAISYHELSLQMRRSIFCEDTTHLDIAGILRNLRVSCSDRGDHMTAIAIGNHDEETQIEKVRGNDFQLMLGRIFSRLDETDVRLLLRVWSARTGQQESAGIETSHDLMKEMMKTGYITAGNLEVLEKDMMAAGISFPAVVRDIAGMPKELHHTKTAEAFVGPSGGEIEISGFSKLSVPPGVVQRDTAITVSTVDIPDILRGDEGFSWISGYPWSLGENVFPHEILDQVLFSPAIDVNLHGAQLSGPVEIETWRPPGSEGMKCVLLKHFDGEGWADITASTPHQIHSDKLSIYLQAFCPLCVLWTKFIETVVGQRMAMALSLLTANCRFSAYIKPHAEDVDFHVVCRDKSVEKDDYLPGFTMCGSNRAMFDLFNRNGIEVAVSVKDGQKESRKMELRAQLCREEHGQTVQMLLNRPNGKHLKGEVIIKSIQEQEPRTVCEFTFREEGRIPDDGNIRAVSGSTHATSPPAAPLKGTNASKGLQTDDGAGPGGMQTNLMAEVDVEDYFDRVISRVSYKWQDLARKLGFNRGDIKGIEATESLRNPNDRCREMLERWRARKASDATLQVLKLALINIDERWTAENLTSPKTGR